MVKSPGEVVIKNAILRDDQSSGRVAAKCCRCKAWVPALLGLADSSLVLPRGLDIFIAGWQ